MTTADEVTHYTAWAPPAAVPAGTPAVRRPRSRRTAGRHAAMARAALTWSRLRYVARHLRR